MIKSNDLSGNLDILDRFLDRLHGELGHSKNTISAYRNDLIALSNFLSKLKPTKSFFNVSSADISKYLVKLQSMEKNTQSRKLSAIRQLMKFMLEEGEIQENPMLSIVNPKLNKPLPSYLSEEEVEKLLNTALEHNLRIYTMLEILYSTGLRVSELVSLKKANVDKEKEWISVIGKGDKERLVPLNNKSKQALEKWLATLPVKSVFLFPTTLNAKSGHITRERFAQVLKDLAIKSGIEPSRVSPHVLRHSFASHLLAHGADLLSIKQLLGHSDISTTEIYTHIDIKRKKEVMDSAHPLSKRNKI